MVRMKEVTLFEKKALGGDREWRWRSSVVSLNNRSMR